MDDLGKLILVYGPNSSKIVSKIPSRGPKDRILVFILTLPKFCYGYNILYSTCAVFLNVNYEKEFFMIIKNYPKNF